MTMTHQMTKGFDLSTDSHDKRSNEPHIAVQILTIIAFGVFSIVAVSLAFAATWIAGLVLTILIALTWSRSRTFGGRGPAEHLAQHVVSEVAPNFTSKKSSGNASFDAYREDTLRRLQDEQQNFENFLNRLRDAKDKTEFDEFMDERATRARQQREDESDS